MFSLRFDLRGPDDTPAQRSARFRAAVAMAEWADRNGGLAVALSEHHASLDGYLPSPLILAGAMAARTERIPITIAACVAPLHDPVRLAEDLIVLDHLSAGRVATVLAAGYRDEEFAMFATTRRQRGHRLDACIDALRACFTGQPTTIAGRPVHVQPGPFTPGGPPLLVAGGSPAAANRAARFGLPLLAQHGDPELVVAYEAACQAHGCPPMGIFPAPGMPLSVHVAADIDKGWSQMGPHFLHDARIYAEWLGESDAATKSTAASIDELRSAGSAYIVVDPDGALDLIARFGSLGLAPMSGGAPPELGWTSLALVEHEVLPRLASPGGAT